MSHRFALASTSCVLKNPPRVLGSTVALTRSLEQSALTMSTSRC
jgi:hypothetical protein